MGGESTTLSRNYNNGAHGGCNNEKCMCNGMMVKYNILMSNNIE